MKKSLWVIGLVGVFSLNTQAADLLGSLKKASDSVDQAQAKVSETQAKAEETSAAASAVTQSPEAAALALVKSKLAPGTTKAQVKEKLGAPVTKSGKKDSESWLYDVSSVNASVAEKAQIAAALGVNAPGADKKVEVKFKGDKVKTVAIAK